MTAPTDDTPPPPQGRIAGMIECGDEIVAINDVVLVGTIAEDACRVQLL